MVWIILKKILLSLMVALSRAVFKGGGVGKKRLEIFQMSCISRLLTLPARRVPRDQDA
jgi:hypothetical protein